MMYAGDEDYGDDITSGMNPTLPGALIEREKKCDLCDCWSLIWHAVEIRGSSYSVCPECRADHADQIRDTNARLDVNQAAEDAAQEEGK